MDNNFLNQIFGYEVIKEELYTIRQWLMDEKLINNTSIYLPKGILLYGEPGCGKTMMIRLYSESFNCPVYNIEGSENQIEEIHEVFTKARKNDGLSIVIIDELDKMINNDCTVSRVLQSELDGMNQSGRILVLSTANALHSIDNPLLRKGRFDRLIELPSPDKNTIKSLLIYTLDQYKVDCSELDIDYVTEMMNGHSGADVKILCNDLYLRAKNNKPTTDDFERSLEAVFGDINDLKVNDFLKNKTVAIHEAGHIVQILRFGDSFDFYKAVFSPEGGKTKFVPKYERETKEIRIQKIILSLSGYAAEKLIFNKVDVGSYSDIDTSFEIARRLIEKSCCYGLNSFTSSYCEQISKKSDSFLHQYKNEKRVIRLIKKKYKEAYCYLKKNKNKLIEISNILLEKGVVMKNDISGIIL